MSVDESYKPIPEGEVEAGVSQPGVESGEETGTEVSPLVQEIRGIWEREAKEVMARGKESMRDFEPPPEGFRVFSSWEELKESGLVDSLIKCYQEVFRESWGEEHRYEDVERRLREELRESAAVALMLKDDEVVGFSWGQALSPEGVMEVIREAPTLQEFAEEEWEKVEAVVRESGNTIFYLSELGILKEARGGIEPLRGLVRPLFVKAQAEGVDSALAWTATHSQAYGLGRLIGFEVVAQFGDIVFIRLPRSNLEALLPVLGRASDKELLRLLVEASKTLKGRSAP